MIHLGENVQMRKSIDIGTWPVDGLESVSRCPVCDNTQRSVLHAGLTDLVFRAAPGQWTLYQCAVCRSAYLDPRPTPDTISLAYTTYYTHDSEEHPTIRRIGRVRTWLHDALNGYMNARYGLARKPATAVGRWLIPLIPTLRAAADVECRHLLPPQTGPGRLLDVGCGNGRFVQLAHEMGWHAEGIDFDEQAVATGHKRHLRVRHGGIELLVNAQETYDVITLSHVIEHVHDPKGLLQKLHELLKPGGTLWIETPNLDSLGHRRYGANWRGLEPPRHLVLFNQGSLRRVLRDTGFQSVSQHWRGLVLYSVFAASEAIARNSEVTKASRQGKPQLSDVIAELYEMLVPRRREFLTVVAHK